MKKITKLSLITIFSLVISCSVYAQSYTVNQQSQQVNINLPVIEKTVYVDRYRTVYVDKPRVAKKLDKPVMLLGYLWVYPEDLGNFKQVPESVIRAINAQNPYGHNNWRIPTPDELAVMEANAEQIGLGDDIYLATDHSNGVLRLVCIDEEYVNLDNFVLIGNTYWAKTNFGTKIKTMSGRPLTYQEALEKAPAGYRLPTEEEALELIYSGEACFWSNLKDDKKCPIFFPCTGSFPYQSEDRGDYGAYWVQGGKILYFIDRSEWRLACTRPYLMDPNNVWTTDEARKRDRAKENCCVRYVRAQ